MDEEKQRELEQAIAEVAQAVYRLLDVRYYGAPPMDTAEELQLKHKMGEISQRYKGGSR